MSTVEVADFSSDAIATEYFENNVWKARTADNSNIDSPCTVTDNPFASECPLHTANYCSTNFENHRACRQPFKKGVVTPNKAWHEVENDKRPFNVTNDAASLPTFVDNIKRYCGANGKTREDNYDTASGKDDTACKGLRKEPTTQTEKALSGLDPNATDLTCKADPATCLTGSDRLNNTCWWARANNDGQFTIPQGTLNSSTGEFDTDICNSIYHCDMIVDDTVVVQPTALTKFNKCKKDQKIDIVKLYEQTLQLVEQQLEEHAPDLKPYAVPIIIAAIAVVLLILKKILFGGGGSRQCISFR